MFLFCVRCWYQKTCQGRAASVEPCPHQRVDNTLLLVDADELPLMTIVVIIMMMMLMVNLMSINEVQSTQLLRP